MSATFSTTDRSRTSSGPMPWTVVMVGTPSSGKTTLLYQLKGTNDIHACAMHGVLWSAGGKTLQCRQFSITSWDLGTRELIYDFGKYRDIFMTAQAIIFVFDSAEQNPNWMQGAMFALDCLLKSQELQGRPLLVLATKQDLPKAVPVQDIVTKLGLDMIHDRQWHVQPTSLVRGDDGAKEGLEWLAKTLEGREV